MKHISLKEDPQSYKVKEGLQDVWDMQDSACTGTSSHSYSCPFSAQGIYFFKRAYPQAEGHAIEGPRTGFDMFFVCNLCSK